MTSLAIIGDTPRRREDARFTTGQGAYLDDLRFDGLVHAVVLRSPHAHARIERIDAAAARAMPGVLAVLTGDDARADGLQPMRPTMEANVQTGEPFAFAPQPLLAIGKVRHMGEPIAVVVAATRAQALDAAEHIAIDWTPLRAVTTAADARAPGAPQIADEVPGNVCMDWHWGNAAAVDAAFASAAHVVSQRIDNHRIVTNPMEPRGAVGSLRCGERPLHAGRLQPEHPRQSRRDRPRTRRAAGGCAVHRARCRRRLRCQELHLCRTRADPVGREARRPAGEMDRHPQRGLRLRPPGARPSGRGVAGARCGRKVPGAAGRQRGEHRRLHGGWRRRGADQPVCAPARQHLRNSRNRAARCDGAEQHHADRRDARSRLCRGGECHRAADRCGGAAVRLRSRGTAPPQHGARRGDADDQCARLLGGQRQFRADLRSCAGGGRCRGICGATRRKRGARNVARAWLRLPHQGHRRFAARECRYPLRARRHGVADHRHADDRSGPRDHVSADPCRSSRHSQ